MKLHNYALSSASYRVRIALNFKGLTYEYLSYHLRRGEQRSDAFLKLNPQGLTPALELDDGTALSQSMAIIEYLEEVHPTPALLPVDPLDRARVRALSQAIACDIHPVNNLRVLKYLETPLGHPQEVRDEWYRHWVRIGFEGLEAELTRDDRTGAFCHGDSPTLADACLVPQVFNARRFNLDMAAYPTIARIDAHCRELTAFADAAPENFPSA